MCCRQFTGYCNPALRISNFFATVTFSWHKAHSSKISYVLCSPLISCQRVHVNIDISTTNHFARPKKLLPTYDNNGIRQNSNYFKVTTTAEVFRNMLIHPEHSEVTPD